MNNDNQEFTTKDSGNRKVFSTGMHRDAGEKDLYRELYGNLDNCLIVQNRFIEMWEDELMCKLQQYCNLYANRSDLERIVVLIHNLEAVKNDERLVGGRCLSLDRRRAALMKRGAIKYEKGNWKKAKTEEELERFKDSLLRHGEQYLNGDSDEDHATAVLFNAGGCAMVEDKITGIIKD